MSLTHEHLKYVTNTNNLTRSQTTALFYMIVTPLTGYSNKYMLFTFFINTFVAVVYN